MRGWVWPGAANQEILANGREVRVKQHLTTTAGYWSKVTDFDPPHLHSAPSYGVTPVDFRGDLWPQKSRLPGLSYGVVV